MNCSSARDNLGLYIDGELPAPEEAALVVHVRACEECAAELDRLKVLVNRLGAAAGPADTRAPSGLWAGIEEHLASQDRQPHPHAHALPRRARSTRTGMLMRILRRPIAAAASLGLLIGVSALVAVWVNQSARYAEAAGIDYAVLLDGLAQDADAAVERFLKHYSGELIAAEAAPAAVPSLNFRIPLELPGGYQRENVYRVRFGAADGVAARYRRTGEPLVIFFHPPVGRVRMGVHRESECHVAGREGQRVEVGPWQLVHFTDPTTCHCLLSKINDDAGQSAVFEAIAPHFTGTPPTGHSAH